MECENFSAVEGVCDSLTSAPGGGHLRLGWTVELPVGHSAASCVLVAVRSRLLIGWDAPIRLGLANRTGSVPLGVPLLERQRLTGS